MVLTSLSSDAYREENSAYSLQRKQIFSAKQHNSDFFRKWREGNSKIVYIGKVFGLVRKMF